MTTAVWTKLRYSMQVSLTSILNNGSRCGFMVSLLVSGSGGRVRALAEGIVLCSWTRHFTLTVPLSTQVYK